MRIVKSIKANPLLFILILFIVWRAVLFLSVYLSGFLFELQNNFLGGGKGLYLTNPYLWSWANFDGEHYLSIARSGYGRGEQAFFPLFPILIRSLTDIFGREFFVYLISGIFISNISFIAGLIGLYRILKLDYSKKFSIFTLVLLLVFPTSFYFGAVYTEGLFLALIVWSFYLGRRGKWLWAALFGILAAGTRFLGILLIPALLIEYFSQKERTILNLFFIFLIPLGLLTYMIYLNQNYNDPFAFFNSLSSFGEQRSSSPIILPQVFYRYVFKILPEVTYSYFPVVFTTLMEFVVGILFLVLSVISIFKLRLSYAVFAIGAYLIPTLTGSFSSQARYVLISFPAFILMALYLVNMPKPIQFLVFTVLFILMSLATAFFVRGYWIA